MHTENEYDKKNRELIDFDTELLVINPRDLMSATRFRSIGFFSDMAHNATHHFFFSHHVLIYLKK